MEEISQLYCIQFPKKSPEEEILQSTGNISVGNTASWLLSFLLLLQVTLQWPGCVLRIVRLLCASLPCKFKSWNTSSRSVRKTSSVLLGKDKILYAGFPFHKLHTLPLYILFNQTYISCFKQQLQRTFKYLKTKRCRKDKLAPSMFQHYHCTFIKKLSGIESNTHTHMPLIL